MKKFVCESLQSFLQLNEDRKIAEDIFAQNNISKEDPLYKRFFDLLKNDEDYMGKFAEWLKNEKFDTIQFAFDAEKDLEEPLNKKIEEFKSFDEYLSAIREKKQEIKNKKIVSEVPKPPVQLQIGQGFGKDLWVYGVLITTPDVKYVKFGDHRAENEQKAKEYAARETVGKLRGLIKEISPEEEEEFEQSGKDIGPFRILFIKKITDYARSIDPDYVEPNPKGGFKKMKFDDVMRPFMPGKHLKGKEAKDIGGESLEIHEFDKNKDWKDIKREWEKAIEDLISGSDTPIQKPYEARKFHEEMNIKISSKESDKHLLGAATGAGKEVITLASLVYINDERKDLFDNNTIHVSCATIPSTELELFEELSRVSGINIKGKLVDFSRIVPYCTKTFANNYLKGLTPNALKWFNKNVKVVPKIKNIPTHSEQQVPVLFGSFQDIGLKASNGDKTERYEELGDRIGILSIGEGHQFLSNAENKLWTSIKEKYHFKFLLLITGTPYDFIFNESGHLYFSPEERTLFTRNDLYEAKRAGDKDFQKYPTFNYYSLDLAKEIEKIKEDEGEEWVGEEGFTYEKLFERKNGKFKYQELIISIFKRFFSIDKKGSPDQLSILEAKDLCEEAKKHVLVALPTGTKDSPAGEYITDLKNLLEENGALGNYTPIAAYEDDLGEIKEKVDEEKGKTITFTCRKLLTGTNIPKWGSLVFLRPIGSSIKFFEQATGRIGRPSKGKTNVGVFLGNIDNIVSLHVSADEKILSNRGESQEYNYIIKRTYDNYNFFGVKGGKWQKLDMPDLVEAVERASMNADYGINLCLNNPKAPEDFNLEFKAPSGAGREEVEVTSQGNLEAKNKRTVERTKQLAIEFEEAKDKDKWYKDMIKTHIPKIVMICLLRNISTIQEFEKEIKRALQENDETLLDMIGKGVDMIPLYIGDDKQIDRSFINRWIDKNNRLTSEKSGEEGFKQRYDVINNKMDIKKLSESIVFDPIKLTDEICEKIKDPLKKADKIMAIEKNGAFTYSILKEIGFENANKLTLIILEPLSEEIIHYIFGENEKLPEIKFIKDINDIENMPQVDIVVGNWPFQKAEGKHKLYPKFTNIAFSVTKPDGYVAFISPKPVIEMLLGRTASQVSFDHGFKEIKYLAIDTPKRYFDVGSSFCYCIVQNTDCNKTNAQVEYYNDKNVIETSSIDLYSGMFLPIPPTKFNVSLVKRVINNKNEFNRSVSRVSLNRKFLKEEGKYEVIEKINKTEGIIRKYTDILHKDAFKDKVIFGVSGDGYLKVKASQGIAIGSPACCYVVTNSEQQSDNLIKFSKHPLVTYIMVNLFDLYQNKNYYFLQWFKKFPLDLDPTDENICENYDITLKEMEYIKKNARFNK